MTAAPKVSHRAFLSLGSNLGDRIGYLSAALAELSRTAETRIVAVSSIYETAPVGPVLEQPLFLNLVAALETGLSPLQLLAACQRVEAALGRQRRIPQGPRVIDVDLLLFDQLVTSSAELTVPHPRMNERAFVLAPLLEIDAELADPRDGRPLRQHLAALGDLSESIRRVATTSSLRL